MRSTGFVPRALTQINITINLQNKKQLATLQYNSRFYTTARRKTALKKRLSGM